MNPPRVLTVPSRVTVCKVYTVRLQRPISLCRTENSVGSPEKVNRAGTRAGSGLRVKTLRAEKSIIDRIVAQSLITVIAATPQRRAG